jgi:CRP/FNR family transcriptional regulator, cyclic AMP receptor protein
MTTEKTGYLSQVDALQDLSQAEIDLIQHETKMVNYHAGHIFYMPEDEGEVLFILKRGRVQLYRMSPDGRKLIVATLHQGAIFGHMALIGQRLHETYAEAVDDCVICIWGRDDVEQLLRRNPAVALRFLDAVGQRLSLMEEMLTEILFKQLPVRLASLLLRLSNESKDRSTIVGYTHQYLADTLGTYRETVTQILNDFKNRGFIKLGRKHITIVQRAGLITIANET